MPKQGWGAHEGLLKEAICKQRLKHSSKKATRRPEGRGSGQVEGGRVVHRL